MILIFFRVIHDLLNSESFIDQRELYNFFIIFECRIRVLFRYLNDELRFYLNLSIFFFYDNYRIKNHLSLNMITFKSSFDSSFYVFSYVFDQCKNLFSFLALIVLVFILSFLRTHVFNFIAFNIFILILSSSRTHVFNFIAFNIFIFNVFLLKILTILIECINSFLISLVFFIFANN